LSRDRKGQTRDEQLGKDKGRDKWRQYIRREEDFTYDKQNILNKFTFGLLLTNIFKLFGFPIFRCWLPDEGYSRNTLGDTQFDI